LEVRIAAMLAREDKMLEVLWEGRDLHSETCARIFGEENKTTRTLSKNILFGSLFGGGFNTVIRFAAKSGVELSEKEAKQFQKQLFEAYPKLKAWHHRAGDVSKEYVYSLRGRRRYIPKGDGYCTRINHPVQSSAADGQKLSMIELARKGYSVVGNIHDEILVEVPSEKAQDALSDVETVMVDSMYRATDQKAKSPVVPIVVEAGIASDWSEKK
jgi:DNA polymerase-1